MVPQVGLQQIKLKSSLFQVNMQLHIEYSRIANQISHNFSSTVYMFHS